MAKWVYHGNGYWGPDDEKTRKEAEQVGETIKKQTTGGWDWAKKTFDTLFNGSAEQIAEKNAAMQERINQANIAAQEKINQDNIKFQTEANKQNLAFANRNFEYQQQLNNQLMQREDTAVQRSMKDYQAAGFNKLLAIGQPAQATALQTAGGSAEQGTPSLQAARSEAYIRAGQNLNILDMALNTMGKINELATSKIQRDYMKGQVIGQGIINDINKIKKLREEYGRVTDKYSRQQIQKQIEALQHNINIATESGRPIGVDGKASNLWSLLDKILSGVGHNTKTSKNPVISGIGKVLKFIGF
nr:MAG TPA: hypothetical protein [Microviridae sp.]